MAALVQEQPAVNFRRHLSGDFISALNELHASPEGEWWRKMLLDPECFVALRDEAVNVYYRGCSLCEARLHKGEVVTKTHYKYLLRSTGLPEYVRGIASRPLISEWMANPADAFIHDLSELKALKDAAKPYAGGEKEFVSAVIKNHDNVFDAEIALTHSQANEESKALRLDLAAAVKTGTVVKFRFYEAKLFTNPEIRATKPLEPKVIGQMRRYEHLLTTHRDQIIDSYKETANNILSLDGMQPHRVALAQAIKDAQDLEIDTQPVLIIVGFDMDQKKGQVWSEHLARLREALPGRVIAAGSASSVRLERTI